MSVMMFFSEFHHAEGDFVRKRIKYMGLASEHNTTQHKHTIQDKSQTTILSLTIQQHRAFKLFLDKVDLS